MSMTLEDFAHRCLMIKAGNATLDIPCCANCKYYNEIVNFKAGQWEKTGEWICQHPEIDYTICKSDDSAFCWVAMKPEDFCSRWESRNEEKEVKEKNKKTRKRKSNNCR